MIIAVATIFAERTTGPPAAWTEDAECAQTGTQTRTDFKTVSKLQLSGTQYYGVDTLIAVPVAHRLRNRSIDALPLQIDPFLEALHESANLTYKEANYARLTEESLAYLDGVFPQAARLNKRGWQSGSPFTRLPHRAPFSRPTLAQSCQNEDGQTCH